jgi:murein L,D-transpeptidase YafK
VKKQLHRLTVYRGTTRLKSYPIVLGANPRNDKLYQGDRCTPEGVYRVVTKFNHPRWDKFILLDYPNMHNWLKFTKGKKTGRIPFDAKIGGDIGIHGTHDPYMNAIGEDWTFGCVSLLNQHIDEIYPLVNEDTLVVIKKK